MSTNTILHQPRGSHVRTVRAVTSKTDKRIRLYPASLIPFLLLFIFVPALRAQSLIEDANTFYDALSILESRDSNYTTADKHTASANILSILTHYDQPFQEAPILVGSWRDLKKEYANNALIQKLIVDSVLVLPDTLSVDLLVQSREKRDSLRHGARQEMMDLLSAEQAVSPATYLSATQALQRYSVPPLPTVQRMELAADGSNQNVAGGILKSPAAHIAGLFEFVLDRAKDEVVVTYLERMLNDDSPHFRTLFPTVVDQFSNRDFTYSKSFIERMRQAFYEDLQKMSVRLPTLLLDPQYFKSIQSNPVAYNLLALYSMVGMAQNDVPLQEIIPVTSRYLYDNFTENQKLVNLTLAEKASGSNEYAEVVDLTETIKGHIKRIFLVLNTAESEIRDSIRIYKQQFPGGPAAPIITNYVGKPSYDLDVLFGDSTQAQYDLMLLPSLLRGELDSAYFAGVTTLETYDKFFTEDRSAIIWRAAGLELANNLNGTWYQDQTMADIFTDWQKDMARLVLTTDKWKESLLPIEERLNREQARFDSNRQKIQQVIAESVESFWTDELSRDQRTAFRILSQILGTFDDIEFDPIYMTDFDDPEGIDVKIDQLDRKRERLLAVENRLIELDQRLFSQHPDRYQASPLDKYLLGREGTIPYAYLIPQIDQLAVDLKSLNTKIKELENNFASAESKSRDNAVPIMQTTELTTHLMYGLRTNRPDNPWLDLSELKQVLNADRRQDVFLGLLTQRLASVKNIGRISSAGLAQLVQYTVEDLRSPDTTAIADSLKFPKFYRKAALVSSTLNRILELPLLISDASPNQSMALNQAYPNLARIPEVSDQALQFIYFINQRDHRHAVSSLVRLFTFLDNTADEVTDGKDDTQRDAAIGYLKKYGDFVADLIDAQNAKQVDDLLSHVSDPPGSSRLKRRKSVTMGLNAYLGGNVGYERWEGDALNGEEETFVSLAPSIPIGISISSLFGEKESSWSLFLSFVDLGGLLTYRADNSLTGENDFNLKNIFKPGVQLHYNFKSSPFYIGAGGQYGPQYRVINNETKALSSTRFFVSLGVDVPIMTFFQK